MAEQYCCDDMQEQIETYCEMHPHRSELCSDVIMVKEPSGYYGIPIHDGGPSVIVIKFCPWCGTKLPDLPEGMI